MRDDSTSGRAPCRCLEGDQVKVRDTQRMKFHDENFGKVVEANATAAFA
jgi:hypothetical protein